MPPASEASTVVFGVAFPLSDAADKLNILREEREKYIDDLPVLASTHADLARVVSHMMKYDQKKVQMCSIFRATLMRLRVSFF